jgi:hypothetical protein
LNETGRLERPGHSSFHISAALDKVRGKAITRLRRLAVGGTTHKDASMKNKAMVTAMLLGMFLGAFAIGFSHPSSAQNAVGGATKPKQSAVGGAATPGPVIGGAAKHGSVGSVPTPGSTGSAVAPGSTAGMAKQTPPIAPPNKGGTVVTATKCAAGSCVAKGTKP